MNRFASRLAITMACLFVGVNLSYAAFPQTMQSARRGWQILRDVLLDLHSYIAEYVVALLLVSTLIVLVDRVKPGRMHPALLGLVALLSGTYFAFVFNGYLLCCGHMAGIVNAIGLGAPLDAVIKILPDTLGGLLVAAAFSIPLFLPIYLMLLIKGAIALLRMQRASSAPAE